jgi:hypothetical protein
VSAGRTYWWAKDAAWLRRELVVELGEEFGPAGPLVLDALNGAAKLENDGGRVRSGFRALSRDCFLDDPSLARRIVEHAGTIGALDDLEIDEDGRRFVARISGWAADQNKGRAAQRQADKRAADQSNQPEDDVTQRDESRPVTHGHVPVGTGQDSTAGKEEEEARAGALQPVEAPTILAELRDLLTEDSLRLAWDDMAVLHAIEAHPWATDPDFRAAARAVASWAAQTTDGPKFRHAARLLRKELDLMDANRTRPGPRSPGAPPRVAGGGRAAAQDRAAEFRRAAAAERAKEARA